MELASRYLYDNRSKEELEIDDCCAIVHRLGIRDFLIYHNNQPKPDVTLIKSSGDKIGYELTDAYWDSGRNGSISRERYETWKLFAKNLSKRFSQKGGNYPYYYGVISLTDRCFQGLEEEIFKYIQKEVKVLQMQRDLIRYLEESLSDVPFSDNFREIAIPENLVKLISSCKVKSFPERNLLWWESSLLSGRLLEPIKSIGNCVKIKCDKTYDMDNFVEKVLAIVGRKACLGSPIVFNMEDLKTISLPQKIQFDKIIYWDQFSESIFMIYPELRALMCEGKMQNDA